MTPHQRAVSQPRHRVALGVDSPHLFAGFREVQQVAFLGGEQEQQPIDKSEKLLVVVLRGQVSAFQTAAELHVPLVLQESVSKPEQRSCNPFAHAV